MKRLMIGFICLILIAGCSTQIDYTPGDNPVMPDRGYFLGSLPIPYDNQSFENCYAEFADRAEFVPLWGKPSAFYELAEDIDGSWGTSFLDDYIRGNGMFPIVHMSFIDAGVILKSPEGLDNATLADTAWRDAYMAAALDILEAGKPMFFSIGNEVNRWYEKYGDEDNDDNAFRHFISLYNEIYDTVKILSPETQVFCTFSREIVSEYREADMSIIGDFDPDRMDILMITSYPHSVQGINRPEDISTDYYTEVTQNMPGKKFGFSEVMWPSDTLFGGEQAQHDFLSMIVNDLTRDKGIDLYMLGWSWFTDIDANDHTGLIKRDGTPKLALPLWDSL